MKINFTAEQLPDMNYQVSRLNRLGFACTLRDQALKPGEFAIYHHGESYTLETCGDLENLKTEKLPLLVPEKIA